MSFEASVQQQDESKIIILRDTTTGAEAEIYSFGGLLNAFRIPVKGALVNIIDGFSSPADARKNMLNGFKSAKLSPFVCRMRKGDYQFENTAYHIDGYYLGDHAIHGLVFDNEYAVSAITTDDNCATVILDLDYQGTDKGFPFPYHLQVQWRLTAGGKLTVSTTVSHQNKQAIPYADGWHPYFTLGGSVDEWTMQFDSQTQLEYDSDLLPTGEKFTDTRFENGTLLKGIELDNSFELDGDHAKCVLSNQSLKLTIEPDKSYPILQVYIPPHRKSIAIENLSGAPDNFNNKINLLLQQPGEEKVFETSYTVSEVDRLKS